MRFPVRFCSLLIALAALALAACAAQTSIVNQWEASAPGPALKKVLVVGVIQNASVRRTFEDQMVAALAARGVDAVAAYRYVQEDGPVSAERMAAAVRQSGAAGVLTTRVLRVDQRQTLVTTGPPVWGPPWGFGAWYGGAWGPGPWGPVFVYPTTAQVLTNDIVVAEVRLFRVLDDQLLWAATTNTFNPSNAAQDSAQFAQVIVEQLAQKGLI